MDQITPRVSDAVPTSTQSLREPMHESLLATDLNIPLHAWIAPVSLAVCLFVIWLLLPPPVMQSWAVSRAALAQGHMSIVALHMLAHGGLVHVLLNAAALILVGSRLIARIGGPVIAWARFVYVLFGSGIAGAGMFLLINQRPSASVLGISGAIFGLLGALARVHPGTGMSVPIVSRRSWLLARMFVRDHLLLLALVTGVVLLTGQSAIIAWEAHLGGMLFGLFVAPSFLPRSP